MGLHGSREAQRLARLQSVNGLIELSEDRLSGRVFRCGEFRPGPHDLSEFAVYLWVTGWLQFVGKLIADPRPHRIAEILAEFGHLLVAPLLFLLAQILVVLSEHLVVVVSLEVVLEHPGLLGRVFFHLYLVPFLRREMWIHLVVLGIEYGEFSGSYLRWLELG